MSTIGQCFFCGCQVSHIDDSPPDMPLVSGVPVNSILVCINCAAEVERQYKSLPPEKRQQIDAMCEQQRGQIYS